MSATGQPSRRRARRRSVRVVVALVISALAVTLSGLPAGAADIPTSSTVRRGTTTAPGTAAAPSTSTTTSTTTTTTTTAPSPAPTDPAVAATDAADEVAGQYIVTLKPGVSPDAVAGESRRRTDRVEHVYRSVARGFSGRLSRGTLARLQADPRVERIEPDQVVYALDTQLNPPSWGLDRIGERARDSESSFTYGTDGTGVTAYVVDTGIYAAHTDFGGRVGPGQNFISGGNPADTNDCNGHGTHVAGTIGGTQYGVAKNVSLVPVRVLDCGGSGTYAGVIAGLDWVTSQNDPGEKSVANLSLGGGFSQSMNDAVARAVADGVVVVVAAGNSNANACNSSPASAPGALTVGATTSTDNRASYSNYGTCVDLFAPGDNIKSTYPGSTTATATLSGTSMASPHVAGVAALYLSAGETATDLMADVTTGLVGNEGTGSPDKLVYAGSGSCVGCPPPPPPPPANDAFGSAQVISTTTGQTTGTTVGATKESGEPAHAGDAGGHSVWYRFTAAATGTATIDTFGSGFDTLLAVYTGSAVNALTQVAANDDASGSQSQVQFPVTAGVTYQVAVDGKAGAEGNVTLHWSLPIPPSGSTGWKNPTLNAPVTSSAGDGNGYQTNPTNAYADDGLYAVDTNSGRSSSTSCTSIYKDKHQFYGYDLSGVPGNATVKGIQVQVQARADSSFSSPRLCVQLSWNGGASWTTAKTTTNLTSVEQTLTVGGTADGWGRTWTPAELANFRVRIINVSSSTSRDFYLDVVSVQVSY